MPPQPADSIETLDYVGGFYPELSPVRLNYVCALNGLQGPALDGEFAYCELGSGLGETTTLLAASYPRASFVGIDLSVRHIEAARVLAAEGQVTNVEFLAADIGRLDPDGLPDFDYITMHGLYSWVPESVREGIDRFVRRKLKPGGVLHVSYNAQPGAHNLATLRRYYLERSARMTGSLLDRASAITSELEALRKAGAPLFRENPTAERLFEIIRDSDRRYMVHEMFAPGWQALPFSEVQSRFAAAGLEFVGDSEVLENLVEHCTLPAFTEAIARVADRIEQESLKDLIHNRSFRRDVYRRSSAGDADGETLPLLSTLLYTTHRSADVSARVQVTGGTVDLSGAWFGRLRELLAVRVMTVDELLNDPVLAQCPRGELLNGLKLASVEGAIGPAATRETPSTDSVKCSLKVVPPLNAALIKRFDLNQERLFLASPVTGRGVAVHRMDVLALSAISQLSPEDQMLARLRQAGISLKRPGRDEAVADELGAMREIASAFRSQRLPKLMALGVVAPTENAFAGR